MSDSESRVLVEVTIAAPLDTVWAAVRDPEQISNWFGWDADTLDDEIAMIFGKPDVVDEREHRLKFGEWEGIADGFELSARGDETLLRVVRFGAPPTDWDEVYSDVREGWVTFVHQLRLWIEEHHGERRRTVYLSGPTPEGTTLSKLLELDGFEGSSAALPSGTADVSVWHRSGFQLGLRVPDWGNGMLVVMDMPADEKRPTRGSLVLTTFGLDDPDAFEKQWTDWWAAAVGNG